MADEAEGKPEKDAGRQFYGSRSRAAPQRFPGQKDPGYRTGELIPEDD